MVLKGVEIRRAQSWVDEGLELVQGDSRAKMDWRPIVAIVFYHGKAQWHVPLQFQDCFKNVDPLFRRYIPNFEYVLVDTSQYADEILRDVKSGPLQASLFLLKYIYDEHLNSHLGDVIQPLIDVSQDEVLDLLWAMLTYMTSATDSVGEAELRTTLTDVFREAEEMLMTIAEKWRLEGEEIGIRKGEEIGIRKGKQDTILRIVESRFDAVGEDLPGLIDRCELAELDELVNLALEIKTLDEFVTTLTELHPTDTDSAEDSSDENNSD